MEVFDALQQTHRETALRATRLLARLAYKA
jgi:hypothetical protein